MEENPYNEDNKIEKIYNKFFLFLSKQLEITKRSLFINKNNIFFMNIVYMDIQKMI